MAPYRVVREVRAIPSFPHGLRIRVVEQLPVAALSRRAGRTAVAADGVVLVPALLRSSLPPLKDESGGSDMAGTVGQHVHGASCWPRSPCWAPRQLRWRRRSRASTWDRRA